LVSTVLDAASISANKERMIVMSEIKGKGALISFLLLLAAANVVLAGQLCSIFWKGGGVEAMPLSDIGQLSAPVHENQDEIIQTFFAVLDDITKVEIWFAPEVAGSTVELSLYDNSTGDYFYDTKEVRLEGGQFELELDHPIQGRKGNEFYLKIVPIQSNGNGIRLFYTSGDYPDNHLLVNGQELDIDIAMTQYTRPDISLAVLIVLTVFLPVDLFCCYEIAHTLKARGKKR